MAGTGTITEQGITLSGASYAVAGRPILSGLTLSLTEARIGIVGRNGSGKTTLLRLMAGLVAPTEGAVRIEGADPADRKAMLRHLGILFQNPDHMILFPTVGEELAFGLRQMGESAERAAAAVDALLAAEGRAHWAKAATATLSQGQRHYLCLLSVLLMRPRTILLDEPFAGLDLPTQARLARRFATLPQRLVTISHDPAAVATADRVIWLDAGRVRADGPPADVLPAFTAEMARIGEADADADLAG
ncbi:energy-coupling factor ABC transporter ATP-binding protein [Paragemmobacter straminiformis]|uniref:ABC transporter ATP-binding protein n=1 Tax=Paragemmobacter straminiformis TaxID=2045119 RepID=A0A842I4A3_9RHOB|nr:ABC transporter ATP-binding protein [Gemmobacter straminiformis]MBC2834345.1 ABC transporter ATP-binding protein [Gemmobacter straminiformis]